MHRICGNAADLADLLHADPRVRAAGAIHHPLLPDHPDHAVARRLPYVTGFANFLHGESDRNTRPGLTPMIDRILAHARDLGVQVTKGASFGFSVPRASPADPMGEGEPTFLRLYAGDREDQVPALAEAVGRALAEYPRRASGGTRGPRRARSRARSATC
ncbi:hypothetical protein ACFQV2_20900 [Actinokineospora soli]|uniref:Uncharacterized protein n=1 Tax=Actinokineospora soli TaxID=1048753 RepID=A0ABW2TPI3_9PSEU